MSRTRLLTACSILAIAAIGVFSKSYGGVAATWVNDSLGGLFYVIFWCLVVFFLWDRAHPGKIAVVVLAVTCALEFLQLWHPHFLEVMRRPVIGRAMLGTSFAWTDIPYYVLGAGIGWMWMSWLENMEKAE